MERIILQWFTFEDSNTDTINGHGISIYAHGNADEAQAYLDLINQGEENNLYRFHPQTDDESIDLILSHDVVVIDLECELAVGDSYELIACLKERIYRNLTEA